MAAADERDRPDPRFGYPAELYNLDAVAYESLMLGVFGIHKGPPNEVCEAGRFPKITDLVFAYSRDGLRWDRPDRTPFLSGTRAPGDWNRDYLHSTGGVCLVVGDKLYIYFAAFSGISPRRGADVYAGGSTGLATLRRDGFVSLDPVDRIGEVTTKPLLLSGGHLFVNADTGAGELRAEILDASGSPHEGFTAEDCRPLRRDGTREVIRWDGAADLAPLLGRPVRLRFRLTNGRLYSFWTTADPMGASYGYLAAGGPGFDGPTDTVGGRQRP